MKRRATLLTVVGMLAATPMAGSLARAQSGPAAATAATAKAAVERGKALYKKAGCYQCHSDQAQGGAQGPRLGPNPIPLAAFLLYVRSPRGEMPPYTAKVMTDQELSDVHAFLQSLPKPPAVADIPLLRP